jgi:DNA-binding NarL/FixJ family response regulator
LKFDLKNGETGKPLEQRSGKMKQSALRLYGIMTGEHMNIFFVEDNPVLSLWLKTYLGRVEGVQVVGSTTSGREAVEKIIDLKPDLALVDIGLPDIDGIQVTREIKKALPLLRVIILTASDDQKDIFAALEAGADGYVLKAQGSPQLEAAIKSVRLGSVWLDPAIAQFVLVNNQEELKRPQRGRETLTNIEIEKLGEVAASNCHDGVCLVEPDFVAKLKRLHHASNEFTAT